jgi:hypothetical protein
MAGTTYLANPALVEINSVDLTDLCSSATYTYQKEALENTAFGQTARTFVAGLENNEITFTFFLAYATGDVYATLQPLVGTTTTIKIKPSTGNESATNPIQILTGAYLAALPVFNGSVGELSTVDVTFQGGTWSADTTNP